MALVVKTYSIPKPLVCVPFLVVIRITPLAPLIPYFAEAVGPFRMLISSISSALILLMADPQSIPLPIPERPGGFSIGTPSTIISG